MGAAGAGSWDIEAINREGMRRLGVSGATCPPLREVEEVGREPLESPCFGVSQNPPSVCRQMAPPPAGLTLFEE